MRTDRRDFLKTALGASTLLSLSPTVPSFLGRTAEGAARQRDAADTILVVVQLAGGNDGLNTVVPFDDDAYAKARPTLRLAANQVHKIDPLLGFHPQAPELLELLKEGQLSVVQGVGYPNPRQDHGESMRIWQTAKEQLAGSQTGWIGRAVDVMSADAPARVPAVFVGQIEPPVTVNAERGIVPTIRSLPDVLLHGPLLDAKDDGRAQHVGVMGQLSGTAAEDPLLGFVRRSTLAAYAAHRQLEAVTRSQGATADYPATPLAQMLRLVAQLIRADLGIRIFCTELGGDEPGGFDTHANQAANHGALLNQLSRSLKAFVADLKRDHLLDRVLLMTFSEFGRTVRENGRRGTDHGSAAPLLLVGGKLRGGLIGAHPNLTELENGGQKAHTDFRRVYATVLDRWLGVDSRAVLPGDFEPLDIVRG